MVEVVIALRLGFPFFDGYASVYPPVKWEGILDAVNRLPVDIAER